MDLLGNSPQYIDANEKLMEERLKVKCNVKMDRASVIAQLRCLASSEVAMEDFRIVAPTLVIAGSDDRLIPSCYARKMAEAIDGAQFIELPGCGHNPFEEQPDVVVPRIVEFLRQQRQPSRLPDAASAGALRLASSPVELCV
jgi:pimeloyl-ACP methyl ester carboxylesterase